RRRTASAVGGRIPVARDAPPAPEQRAAYRRHARPHAAEPREQPARYFAPASGNGARERELDAPVERVRFGGGGLFAAPAIADVEIAQLGERAALLGDHPGQLA